MHYRKSKKEPPKGSGSCGAKAHVYFGTNGQDTTITGGGGAATNQVPLKASTTDKTTSPTAQQANLGVVPW